MPLGLTAEPNGMCQSPVRIIAVRTFGIADPSDGTGRKVGSAGKLPDTRSGLGAPAATHRGHNHLAARHCIRYRIRLSPKRTRQEHTRRGKGRGTQRVGTSLQNSRATKLWPRLGERPGPQHAFSGLWGQEAEGRSKCGSPAIVPDPTEPPPDLFSRVVH